MAPFLFLIIAEGLNGLLRRAVELDRFRGFSFGRGDGVTVSMVQFADDTLFIGEASYQNVETLKCMLRCFELVSGLKVNFHKSKLIGVKVEDGDLSRFASSLHRKTSSTPFKFLGLMVGGNPQRIYFWDDVIKG